MGAGVNGTNLDQYTKYVQEAIIKHLKDNELLNLKRKGMLIDDNQQFFLRDLARSELKYYINTFGKPTKNGNTFDINGRQTATQTGMFNDLFIFHAANTPLINDFRICQKKNAYDPTRDTAGTKNYLDRIDSFEYGFQPFTHVI